jgi:precorrin-3B synthase
VAPLVHVSGCAKGCAHAGSAELTLVGANGLYNLVMNGRAGDRPVASGLSLEDALAAFTLLRSGMPR